MIAWQFTLQAEARPSHAERVLWGEEEEGNSNNKNPAIQKSEPFATQKSFYVNCDPLKCSHL